MNLAILLIHYHTPALAAEAVEALYRDLAGSGLAAELVIVDNGSDAAGRERLAGLPARLLTPETNLGYAGGINHGVAATTAERVVAMNPDVLVEPGCLAALTAELAAGADAAGPRFFLDRSKRLCIPPTELRQPSTELLAVLAARGEPWTRWARHSWRRHARRHWRAEAPLASRSLSGALLAFTRRAFEIAGPFDEGLELYFEEDDWLGRFPAKDLTARHVPSAEAVHLHARSTAAEPRAQEWFAASRARFERRHYSPLLRRLLRWLTPGPELVIPWPLALPPGPPRLPLDGRSPRGVRRPLWVELATSARGYPAAAQRLEPEARGVWELPREVWEALGPERHVLQLVDDDGVELARRSFLGPREAAA